MKSLSLAILLLAGHLLAFATAQSDTNVIAYYTNYDPESKDWDLSAAKVFCASFNGSASLEWRSKYGWTAFCGNNGPQGEEACGKCLNVTNKATGAKETVRIVDTCGSGGLDLDLNTAFLPIDTDGTGFSAGHLTVDYEFVDCDSTPLGPGETDVTAYYTDYKPKENNWDLNAAAVSCATKDGSKSLEWRSKYGWTAFCGSVGPQGENACGLCLKVINTSTKDEEIVRIVDACGSGGLDLDLETAFRPIDTDGKGFNAGHLTVDYNFVDCGDSDEAKIRVFSQ